MDKQAFRTRAEDEITRHEFKSLDGVPVKLSVTSVVSNRETLEKVAYTGNLKADFKDGRERNIVYDKEPALDVDGKVLTGAEVHDLIFTYDEDQKCWMTQGYSLKTQQYLKQILREIGLVAIYKHYDYYGIELEDEEIISRGVQQIIVVGRANNRNILKIINQPDIDTWIVYEFLFEKEITDRAILDAVSIVNLRDLIKQRRNEWVTCYECGRSCHWTDIFAPDFYTKVNNFEENFCGSCDVPPEFL